MFGSFCAPESSENNCHSSVTIASAIILASVSKLNDQKADASGGAEAGTCARAPLLPPTEMGCDVEAVIPTNPAPPTATLHRAGAARACERDAWGEALRPHSAS